MTTRNLQLLTLAEWRRRHLPGVPSKISSDAEVRQFVTSAFDTMTFDAIADACRKKFGPKRAPGKSAVHRYWQKSYAARGSGARGDQSAGACAERLIANTKGDTR